VYTNFCELVTVHNTIWGVSDAVGRGVTQVHQFTALDVTLVTMYSGRGCVVEKVEEDVLWRWRRMCCGGGGVVEEV
jgi:hypothetical protein